MTKIKQLRTKLGLTQSELANLLGLSSYTRIAEYESGKRNPSFAVRIILYLLAHDLIAVTTLQKVVERLRKE